MNVSLYMNSPEREPTPFSNKQCHYHPITFNNSAAIFFNYLNG